MKHQLKTHSVVLILLAITGLGSLRIAQAEDSTDRWFGKGLAWYQHPCGLRAFSKYGDFDTPETRQAYELTKRHPELCSRMFP